MKKQQLFEKAEREFTPICRLNNCQAYIGYFYIDGRPVYALKSYNTITAVAFICVECEEFCDHTYCYVLERDYYSQTSSKHLSKFMYKISRAHFADVYRYRLSVWVGNHIGVKIQKYYDAIGWNDLIELAKRCAIFVDVDSIKGV